MAFSTTELSDLLMNVHKINVYNNDVFVYINLPYQFVSKLLGIGNCEQFRTKCYAKTAAMLT